jgi:Xaa-Pro aminopeptidase
MTSDRLTQLKALPSSLKIDGLLLNNEANVSYAAGFRTPDTYAFITRHDIALITDFRYVADFQRHAPSGMRIIEHKKSLFHTIALCARESRLKTLGFESRHLAFAECEILHKLLGKKISFVPVKNSCEALREIKTSEELALIRKAVDITLDAYSFIESKLTPGTTELEIAAEIERFIRIKGARAGAFDIIVASGPNASYPHATVSRRRIQKGEPVIIDMGVDYKGYKSDLTRTFFLGKMPPIVRKAADTVRQAQEKAIQTIKPGVPLNKIDRAARHFIGSEGFGKYFGHALGHGIGLEVHEAPSVNKTNRQSTQEGMVFTVEPGIYISGEFGIRMEEMILVTNRGVEVISGNYRKQPDKSRGDHRC